MVRLFSLLDGEVSEWFKELVLKTSDSQEPWVRIPPSPPNSLEFRGGWVPFHNKAVRSRSEIYNFIKAYTLTDLEKYSSW